jgi:glyoxylase I family protein
MAFHHVAFATKDLEATHHFYEDLMGFPLVHSELEDHGV